MLENLVYDAMAIIGLLLMALGFKILLTPMPPCGMRFVLREVSQHFHVNSKSLKNQQYPEVTVIAVCFLKENSFPNSDRSLAYWFGVRKKEVAQVIRKGKWLIGTNEDIGMFYDNLDVKFANARWWELI